jgi:anti-sigma factor ChrR (cupin superfamily)
MKVDIEKLNELAALQAIGALDGQEADVFSRLLEDNAEARRELAGFGVVAESLLHALPTSPKPSAGLKDKILQAAEQSSTRNRLEGILKRLAPAVSEGFSFVHDAMSAHWLPLKIPGAYVKLLSFDSKNNYATVLGKLDPGARYPSHPHRHPEDIYMLSGDLHIGEQTIRAGDFHHAEAGTTHGVNWSEQGCVLLAVLSKEDLLEQFARV